MDVSRSNNEEMSLIDLFQSHFRGLHKNVMDLIRVEDITEMCQTVSSVSNQRNLPIKLHDMAKESISRNAEKNLKKYMVECDFVNQFSKIEQLENIDDVPLDNDSLLNNSDDKVDLYATIKVSSPLTDDDDDYAAVSVTDSWGPAEYSDAYSTLAKLKFKEEFENLVLSAEHSVKCLKDDVIISREKAATLQSLSYNLHTHVKNELEELKEQSTKESVNMEDVIDAYKLLRFESNDCEVSNSSQHLMLLESDDCEASTS